MLKLSLLLRKAPHSSQNQTTYRTLERIAIKQKIPLSTNSVMSSDSTSNIILTNVRGLKTTSSHYETHSSANSYEKAYFYEPGDYMEYLVELVRNELELATDNNGNSRRLLDIGGGTGNFTKALIDKRKDIEAIVVDPYLAPTDNIILGSTNKKVKFVKEPAEVFLRPPLPDGGDNKDWWRANFHQVLLKEIVHHLKPQDRVEIFRGIYQEIIPFSSPSLESNSTESSNTDSTIPPSIIIITRPQSNISYPLWDDARQVWKDNQPSTELFIEELKQAGFVNIQANIKSYPCEISLSRWQTMIKNRIWSTFSHFTDKKLEEGCKMIENDYPTDKNGNLHFDDQLVIIKAKKNN